MWENTKSKLLREQGVINTKAHRIQDPFFLNYDFFDPKDIVQVKYEMIRRVQKDGLPITQVTENFGFSRPAFYNAQQEFQKEGIIGLIPKKRGPKGAHKLDSGVMEFIENILSQNKKVNSTILAKVLKEEFGFTIHPRSIERALEKRKKKALSQKKN